MKQAAKMRELLKTKNMVVAPGAHDAMTAKIIGRLGFDAVYMTGYGQSASHLGQPDVGLMTMSEMVARAANIVEAAGVPVIADADTGFGNHDDIDGRQFMLLVPKTFARQSLDAITPDRPFECFFGHGEAEAWMAQSVGFGQQCQMRRGSPDRLIEDIFEMFGS